MGKQIESSLDQFEKFNLLQLLKGSLIYKFKIFYEIKNLLMKYDEDTDYVNYGYWADDAVENPSKVLVNYLISKLKLKPADILLNVGSGMGQPDVDIINDFTLSKIIGINIVKGQVDYSNDKFKALGIDHIVEHRLINSDDIVAKLDGEGITAVVSIEAIADIVSIDKFIQNSYDILPEGGRICFCGEMKTQNTQNIFKKIPGGFLMKITTILYGDHWRMVDVYKETLEASGFDHISCESIGANVYPKIYQHAKQNFTRLKEKKVPLVLKILAYFNMYGLNSLFERGQIDYMIFYAEKHKK